MTPEALIGLEYKKLIRGHLQDVYHIGKNFISRRTIEKANSEAQASKYAANGLISFTVSGGKIDRVFGLTPENRRYFEKLNYGSDITYKIIERGIL